MKCGFPATLGPIREGKKDKSAVNIIKLLHGIQICYQAVYHSRPCPKSCDFQTYLHLAFKK